MEKLHKDKFISYEIDNEKGILFVDWKPATEDMEEDEFKEEISYQAKYAEEYHPTKFLVNSTKLQFSITPQLQDWAQKTVFTRLIEAGVRKTAFVMPEDLVAQLSVEQAMEEEEGLQFVSRYFDNDKEALEWLEK